jgi:nucleoside-diphosphate-sugar epimerase
MIALVTGANGFLGRALVARLLEAAPAPTVRCVVRSEQAAQTLKRSLAASDLCGAEVVVGTLSDSAFVRKALDGVDVLYHLAASPRGAAADIFLNTVVASGRILEGMRATGTRPHTVLVSSFGVYGVSGLCKGAVIDERTPLEPHPEWRDHYSHAKLRQEMLFRDFARDDGLPLTVLRPGSIYGPGGNVLPSRVGLRLPGLFLVLGGANLLPLSFVGNCAEALRAAGSNPASVGRTYNVHDDDLPSCREYFRLYRKHVKRVRWLALPYTVTLWLAYAIEWYHRHSRGQLPAFLTPYRVKATWKGCRFDNGQLKSLGWRPLVSPAEGLRLTFEAERGLLQGTQASLR